jgi:integrase
MSQQGSVHRKGPSWYLRYRDSFLVNGVLTRKQKIVFLAHVSGRYRREGDLKDIIEEKLSGVKAAAKCPESARPFTDYVENIYMPFVLRTMKASTYAGYQSYWKRYLKPRVGDYILRDFTVAVTSELLDSIVKMHKLNCDTIGKVRSILSGIFTYAMGKGHFPGRSAADNPASRALIPEGAGDPGETVAATREEVTTILKHLDKQGMTLERAAVALAAFTGVRPGELRGLRWEEWDRTAAQIKVMRSVWHAVEGTTKTQQSVRFVAVTDELRSILLSLWKEQGSPISGYILQRDGGERVNLDNMAKRDLIPALSRCAICQQSETAEHKGHTFERDESLPHWHGWYALRRFHGTQVRQQASTSETMAKALGNSRAIADRHYLKATEVLPDVRKAVNSAMRGLV